MTRTHVPVLAGELIEMLDPQPGEIAVDCTFGAGGHARLVAERIGPTGTLICIDRDPVAASHFEEFAAEVACDTRFLSMEFAAGLRLLREEGLQANLAYLDLGVSSMQLDAWERGFSYSYDAPLDMRMDPDAELTAAEVVNTYDQKALSRVLREFGEERFASRIASQIVRRRAHRPFSTTSELVELLYEAIPAPARRTGGHPAKRTFQALRIAVNGELDSLRDAIPAALGALAPGGRIVVMAYQSLEDRIVKNQFAAATASRTPPDLPVELPGHEPVFVALTRGAERAGPEEIELNPRSASVRLRALEKVGG
jgi:16S rRNA (cytosine1402-N4)-methyltransferase